MYICNKCGDLIDELPTETEYEECWGRTVSWEEDDDSCSCGGTYVDAVKCVHCDEYIPCDLQYSKELEKKFDEIPEDYVKDVFTPAEQQAEAEDFCEYCLKEIIQEYEKSKEQR